MDQNTRKVRVNRDENLQKREPDDIKGDYDTPSLGFTHTLRLRRIEVPRERQVKRGNTMRKDTGNRRN